MNCYTIMWRVALLAILIGWCPTDASAQRRFPYQFDLNSISADTLSSPDATSARHRYRVTAWGTYSMWEDTLYSSVDPVWIYSFPEEEWDKPEWRIFPEGPLVYVGDQRMFDSHGLRINGSPMPKFLMDSVTHTYSMIIQGDGRPITTSIVDWNFKELVKRDAHDNNSGWLHVLVEELPLTEMEICGVDSSNFPVIRVSLKVLRDSILFDGISEKLILTENGIPVHIDSMDCSERVNRVSVAMVFDRSGSMRESWQGSTRIAATKAAGRRFIDKLTADDEGAIYSFNEYNTRDQYWTTDKAALNGAIDRLSPSGYTAMNDAVIVAIGEIESRPDYFRKALVVLSDGKDNRSQIQDIQTIINRANLANVPVFVIGLLLDDDMELRRLAAETGGVYFSVSDVAAMDSVFTSIADRVFEKGCCSVYYTSPRKERDGSYRPVQATVSFMGDTVLTHYIGYQAPGFGTSDVEFSNGYSGSSQMVVTPNPASNHVSIAFKLHNPAIVRVSLLDVLGKVISVLNDKGYEEGEYAEELRLEGLVPGRYFIRMELPRETLVQPLQVIR